jgi:hypothetical protein
MQTQYIQIFVQFVFLIKYLFGLVCRGCDVFVFSIPTVVYMCVEIPSSRVKNNAMRLVIRCEKNNYYTLSKSVCQLTRKRG